ncbi:MAG: EAL domain-containing protein [Campylobacterales bacterium]|nr:EAL domain-containing protein [Campylobacterales bacterium]
MDNNGVELYYQPIYNNLTNKIEKFETLMRLKVDDKILYPDSFLGLSKEIKKYRKLTNSMIDKSFQFFHDKSYEFSINLSAEDIFDKDFEKFFFDKIEQYKIADRLVVEIVESETINDYNYFYEFIIKVKNVKAKVAIDDFGSGYSNYEHLLALSEYVDYLKIDGSLIKNVLKDHKSKILVESIQNFCKELGMKTIAEYVEDEELLNYLKRIGVNYSQGYYIGKPQKELKISFV